MHQIVKLTVALVVFSRVGCTQSLNDWHQEKDQEGIRVFSRHLTDNRLKELRVQCTCQGTLSALVAMLSDIEHYPRIMYKTKTTQVLRRVSDTDLYYYIETELPWPVENRDMNVHLTFAQEPQTRTLRIRVDKAADEVPPKPHVVRVVDWSASWEVHPLANQQLQIDYQCRVNPGGTLPAWLVNLTSANGPYESFKLLRKSMQDARYQGRKFSFLVD